ncbi:hypothetical protein EVAR_62274_1 [Eumeta japonica]|uniref:Uncharacterized protein n=1 Tax=Eumeta variegata TaxID=151549 RepID=A0A4C1YV64_EUMVA|nr:hypothetical protein EVAR_62274_1 [Eumeta japonica]
MAANRGNDMPSHLDSGGKKQVRTRRRDSRRHITGKHLLGCSAYPRSPRAAAYYAVALSAAPSLLDLSPRDTSASQNPDTPPSI